MVLEGINLNAYEFLALVISVPTLISIPLTAFLVKLRIKTELHDKEIEEVDEKIDKSDNSIEARFQEHKIDAQQREMELQKEIDSVKMDVKGVISKIDVLVEKVTESEKIHIEIKQMIRDQQTFFVDWIQRVEDVTRDDGVLRHYRRKRTDTQYSDPESDHPPPT